MAFDLTKLCRVGSDLAADSVKHYNYVSTDTVTGAGYFPTTSGIKAGDIVTKIAITLTNGLITAYTEAKYYMVANASGVLTATSLTTSTSVAAGSVSADSSGFTVVSGSTVQAALASIDTALIAIDGRLDALEV